MGQVQDFFSQYGGEVSETVDKNALTLPDLSGLSVRNPNEYDCKRCPLTHSNAEPGECWNVSVMPYMNTFDQWITSTYNTWISAMDNASNAGNYGEGEQLALEVYNWSVNALSDLQIHRDWINHMKSNITLDRRCCVSRTGPDNFNNGYVPKINELETKLTNLRDEMQSYVFQFQGVAPPPSAGSGTGDYVPGEGTIPGQGGNQFGEQQDPYAPNPEDSENLKKFLIGGAIALIVTTGLIIYSRRK